MRLFRRAARDGWALAAHGATATRVAAIPVVLLLLALPGPAARFWAAGAFFAAALTDALDGPLARRSPRARSPSSPAAGTALGAVLDQTADKLLVTAVLIDLAGRGLVPAWVAIVIVARELIVAGARAYAAGRGRVLAVRVWGKVKMALSALAVPLAILEAPGATLLLALTAAVTVVSAWPYLSAAAARPKGDGGAPADPPRL